MSIELFLGGARSGKSRLAEERALQIFAKHLECRLTYVATATANDEEMQARIKQHQAQRDGRWMVVEEPFELTQTLSRFTEKDVVLVDCLTLWLTNWLCDRGLEAYLVERSKLLAILAQSRAHILMVSNEVGHGIVPMGVLSRQFVDESGRLHQMLAQVASRVDFIIAGLPLTMKPS
ncbi:bifunctional adenosylcobinamide kinase/adenosylcobinamide-phosphate guanylyltransferase [Pseudoalteromonas xiamenensis]|uniref:bifunctional adenosylcobinamide kinase/adenosylcobinamide-phosphate guanylyltransferase n=1 Tax=Pseudoalteromonas xiamenensis TaxID=882626 RepID=UPI0027E48387|nr:bifunctional adenosylcobinamide kinase/adenosylcobinamide-phosphate guanylyltransferase [Pseudoalteromonas xiamenensis]WMN59189.1 bifunctional adenosylcobinamide kinase/adenosylcobinamide-phosphate guanylyltransferase [Pseudoalteromonas xiamenensis]